MFTLPLLAKQKAVRSSTVTSARRMARAGELKQDGEVGRGEPLPEPTTSREQ